MTATPPPVLTARRVYRHPETGRAHVLTYAATKTGHVVTHHPPAGEEFGPAVTRTETVDGARVVWYALVARITRDGYRRT